MERIQMLVEKDGCIVRVVLGRGEERESRGKLAEAVCCCRQLLGSSGQKQPALPQQPPTIPPISSQLADFLGDKNYCLFCISEVSF